jgi:hypothetical protein
MLVFEKIKMTCILAADQSLQYAWVDTCCIDKRYLRDRQMAADPKPPLR